MTFEQLESFIAAVKFPTFFDAAESLHITQSTLSKQIMKLERELDVTLLDRSRRSASLTGVLRDFSSCHSEINLSITEAEEQELLDGLDEGQFDLIIIRGLKADPEKHRFYPLAKDRLVAVLPMDHPLAAESSVTLSQLSGESFLLMPPHTSIHELYPISPMPEYSRERTGIKMIQQSMPTAVIGQFPLIQSEKL